MKNKKLKIFASLAIIILCLGLAVHKIWAAAGGSQQVYRGPKIEIQEEISNMEKHVVIQNTSQINDCFVRIKIFAGGKSEVEITSQDWTLGQDGYYYYSPIVPAAGSTNELLVKINANNVDTDSFNVIVAAECTAVIYDENGDITADWNAKYNAYNQ